MPRLILISEFKNQAWDDGSIGLDPSYYFKDTNVNYFHRGAGGPPITYDISKTYPGSLAIHIDNMKINDLAGNELKISIREYVEQNCIGDVILMYKNMDYNMFPKDDKRFYSDNRINVEHGYHIFHFKYDNDVVLFKLKFSDYISEIQKLNPNSYYIEDDYEYCK